MEIKNIKLVKDNNFNQLSYDVWHNGSALNIWFHTDAEQIADDGDIFLSALLLPSMMLGETLVIDKPVSPVLMGNVDKLQDIFSSWYPKFHRIEIKAEVNRNTVGPPPTEIASFFSGGVDSFYTLIKNNDEITTLVNVQGFDVWAHETEFLEKVHPRIVKIAKEFDKKLITVRTNIHEFSDKFAEWAFEYHGCALASVAHLLSPAFKKIIIPSSYGYKYLFPFGSHLLTDHLWSTDKVSIVHDGEETNRPGKVRKICQNQSALENLRVCLDRRRGNYNCGTCEKCLRTMLNLYIYDSLQNCNTFSNDLTPRKVAGIKIKSDNVKNEYEEILKELKINRPGSPYIRSVKMVLIRYEIKTLLKKIKSIFAMIGE